LTAETSNPRTTLSLTSTPPVSSAAFQVMPTDDQVETLAAVAEQVRHAVDDEQPPDDLRRAHYA
jgi:hypothetical protein